MNKTFSIKIEYGGRFTARHHVRPAEMIRRWTEDRHCNAGFELHYCLKGHAHFICEHNHYEMEKGDAILVAPGVYHSSSADDPDLVHFSISLIQPDFQAEKMLLTLIGGSRTFQMNDQLKSLCGILISEGSGEANDTMISSLISAVTVATLRQVGAAGKERTPEVHDSGLNRTDIIDNFLEEHFMENGAEKKLAEKLGLSRRQLMRVIAEEYGESYRAKLLSARMDKAALLLRSSSLSVSEVCLSVGYTSETAFFKQFRKKFGKTPSGYREIMKTALRD